MLKWNVQGLLLQISHKRNCKNEFDIESFFFFNFQGIIKHRNIHIQRKK